MTENRQSSSTESIHDTHRQSRLGAHHSQVNLVLLGETQQSLHIGIFQPDVGSDGGSSRITGCAKDLSHLRRTMQRICNGMFATSASDD